ncbi:hypothetical protein CEUSTIGMA_g11954.t1 [Chlamydomonas eustigma]|uniref:Helicase ATP-binding domain-containing protein n=1 Tax=Chlamydomonas eustigma TaxID=1157962 RepID=A0A250XNG5_9CHLO|nr:hypothetical protein CEUSTIGMA_g11954.t1 [Chlamydomonas eustigma]|eukprot:GAX84533.1 hypothetical protein CEUSTIGMA_g11954.t1 [Chlamydomonas eustigma]
MNPFGEDSTRWGASPFPVPTGPHPGPPPGPRPPYSLPMDTALRNFQNSGPFALPSYRPSDQEQQPPVMNFGPPNAGPPNFAPPIARPQNAGPPNFAPPIARPPIAGPPDAGATPGAESKELPLAAAIELGGGQAPDGITVSATVVFRVVRVMLLWIAFYFVERAYEATYIERTLAEGGRPPSLKYLVLAAVGLEVAFTGLVFLLLAAVSASLKSPNNSFVLDGPFLRQLLIEYILSTAILVLLGIAFASVAQDGSLFRYQEDGARGIRALCILQLLVAATVVFVVGAVVNDVPTLMPLITTMVKHEARLDRARGHGDPGRDHGAGAVFAAVRHALDVHVREHRPRHAVLGAEQAGRLRQGDAALGPDRDGRRLERSGDRCDGGVRERLVAARGDVLCALFRGQAGCGGCRGFEVGCEVGGESYGGRSPAVLRRRLWRLVAQRAEGAADGRGVRLVHAVGDGHQSTDRDGRGRPVCPPAVLVRDRPVRHIRGPVGLGVVGVPAVGDAGVPLADRGVPGRLRPEAGRLGVRAAEVEVALPGLDLGRVRHRAGPCIHVRRWRRRRWRKCGGDGAPHRAGHVPGRGLRFGPNRQRAGPTPDAIKADRLKRLNDPMCDDDRGLSLRGYWILKASLSGAVQAEVKRALTMTPTLGCIGGGFGGYGTNGGGKLVLWRETATKLYLPRFYGVQRFGAPNSPPTHQPLSSEVRFEGKLRDEQRVPIDAYLESARDPRRMGGILSLPCGFGKTVAALYIVRELGVKTVVIVHKDFLMDQWRERIAQYLPGARVGVIKAKEVDVEDKDVVMASLQSLSMKEYDGDTFRGFGLLIVDECHRVGTEVFSRALLKVSCRYALGISATVDRKDGMTKAFVAFLGDVVFRGKRRIDDVQVRQLAYWASSEAYGREETMSGGRTNMSRMINNVTSYAPRTEAIVLAIAEVVAKEPGRKVLVLSDRKAQLRSIQEGLEREHVSAGFYWGGMKRDALEVTEREKQVMCATFAYAAEGMDVPSLDTLVLASPKSDIEQSVGRILRQKAEGRDRRPLVLDVVDQFSLFERQGAKRAAFYRRFKYDVKQYPLSGEA